MDSQDSHEPLPGLAPPEVRERLSAAVTAQSRRRWLGVWGATFVFTVVLVVQALVSDLGAWVLAERIFFAAVAGLWVVRVWRKRPMPASAVTELQVNRAVRDAVKCPSCGFGVLHDDDRCPRCGSIRFQLTVRPEFLVAAAVCIGFPLLLLLLFALFGG